jgi:hypothetical protein
MSSNEMFVSVPGFDVSRATFEGGHRDAIYPESARRRTFLRCDKNSLSIS